YAGLRLLPAAPRGLARRRGAVGPGRGAAHRKDRVSGVPAGKGGSLRLRVCMMPESLPKRSELPLETTWDVHSIFPDDAAWEAAAAALETYIPRLEAFRGRRGESAGRLLEWILLEEQLIVDEGN